MLNKNNKNKNVEKNNIIYIIMLKINFFIFSVSLFIGLFFVYIYAPRPKIIIKYPTVKNANKLTYIDENNNCYKYIPKPVNCPKK